MTRKDFKRFVIYARSATDSDGGQAIEAQLEVCRHFVEQEGGSVVAECTDAAASGLSTEHPGLQKALSIAAAGKCDALVVQDLSRISRDLAQCIHIDQRLKDADVELQAVHKLMGLPRTATPTER
ncbi:recombinase family protein [Rhodovulum adriaticum]|uniref:recombinase family protein n=1 Tax=Rhodovulum adriaticum TaxID=35804 RepID=UPI0014044C0C|nr:recombinase family protein [Rhodovulum adriaticum]